jgi:GT2 family glycosyltransferase
VDASVIVIDWHRPELTRRALDSILAQRTSRSVETVLVVNEADPAQVAAFRADYPAVVVVEEPTNSGFAGGVVRGMAAATGDVIVLVNNDAVADNAFLERGLAMLDAVPEQVAALAATTVLEGTFVRATGPGGPDDLVATDGGRWRRSEGGSSLLNGSGVVLDTDGNGRDRDWLGDLEGTRERAHLFGFSGGAAFLRRGPLAAVGGFDPDLFMYYEDVDVSWRLRLAGWDIRHVPDAVVVHRHAGSSGSDSQLVRYQSMRNRLAVVLRDGSMPMVRRVVLRTLLRAAADMVRPGTAQLSRSAWLRLGREARGIVRNARRLRRSDGFSEARRREVERAVLDR